MPGSINRTTILAAEFLGSDNAIYHSFKHGMEGGGEMRPVIITPKLGIILILIGASYRFLIGVTEYRYWGILLVHGVLQGSL